MNDATSDRRLNLDHASPPGMRPESRPPSREKAKRPPVREHEPYEGWAPPGVDLGHVAPAIRDDIFAAVRPVYEDLVLATRDGLERSTGLTIVHLMCQEILRQAALYAERPSTPVFDPILGAACSGEDAIEKYLRIVESKVRVSAILVQLRLYRLRRRARVALRVPTARPALLVRRGAADPAVPAPEGLPVPPEARDHVAEIQNL